MAATALSLAALCCAPLACRAQVTVDGRLGPAGTLAGPGYAISSNLGRQVGGNLFHSFGQFNVQAGQTATFYNPSSVSNIIGRVTGSGYSTIDGTIRTRLEAGGAPTGNPSTASLWLINPMGILFGPNAQLDVGGSFHASSADYLKLGTGAGSGKFHASRPAASTLTSAAPSAFGFVSAAPQPVIVNGSALVMDRGATISLVGGGVGLFNDALVLAPGGRINVASVAGPGEISPAGAGIGASAGTALGDAVLAGSSLLAFDSAGGDSGAVYLRAGKLELRSGGSIDVSAYAGSGNGGLADVRAAESVLIDGSSASGFRSGVYASALASGSGGRIAIAAPAVTVSNGGRIQAATGGDGAGGTIGLEAGRLELLSGGHINAGATTGSNGNGGSVTVRAAGAIVADGAGSSGLTGILANAQGAGDAGTITILEAPLLALSNGATVSAATFATGKAGTIAVNAGRVDLSGEGSIDASTFAGGDAGKVTVQATGPILIDGLAGALLSTGILANTSGSGKAGDLSVAAPALTVINGGAVSSTTTGSGDAGNVTVAVDTLELLSGSWIMSGRLSSGAAGGGAGGKVTVTATGSILIDGHHPAPGLAIINSALFAGTGGAGPGGELIVTAPAITLSNGGAIQSFTTGSGAAGAITVNAGRLELAAGGFIDTSGGAGAGGKITVNAGSVTMGGFGPSGLPSSIGADTSGSAPAGDISVTTPLLTIADGATIRSTTIGTGAAGSIQITAGRVEMRDRALITVQSADGPLGGPAVSGGPAGSITIDAGSRLTLSGDSRINARTESAPAGDIHITARELVYLRDSQISTSVAGGNGNGGNIIIDPIFVVLDNSQIIANALRGNGGNITIVSDFFLKDPESVVQASSRFGLSGTITTTAPNVDVSAGLAALPSGFFDASLLLRESCAARAGRESNSFTGVGRGGLPASPAQLGFGGYAGTLEPNAADNSLLWLANASAAGCLSIN